MIQKDLKKKGYDKEEEYFNKLNKELIKKKQQASKDKASENDHKQKPKFNDSNETH